MDYGKFYDIAEYGSKEWRGFFSPKEIAGYAYEYMSAYEWSKENEELSPIITELIRLLKEDGSEQCMDWADDIMSDFSEYTFDLE